MNYRRALFLLLFKPIDVQAEPEESYAVGAQTIQAPPGRGGSIGPWSVLLPEPEFGKRVSRLKSFFIFFPPLKLLFPLRDFNNCN